MTAELRSSSNARYWIAAAVLASPFVVFVALLLSSPSGAGFFAGSLLGRITDPVVLVGMIFAAGVAATGARWVWALLIGLAAGALGVGLAFLFWARVAGTEVADREAATFVVWTMALAGYAFVAGRLLYWWSSSSGKSSSH